MSELEEYHKALLYLSCLIALIDGYEDHGESRAIERIKKHEKIPDDIYRDFKEKSAQLSKKEIFQEGMTAISKCEFDYKLRAFAYLYKLLSIGKLDAKEVKLLSLMHTIEGLVMEEAKQLSEHLPDL